MTAFNGEPFDVSVFMFTYRPLHSKRNIYIREALLSLRKQKGVNIQAVVLDDGSPSLIPGKLLTDTENIKFRHEHFKRNRGKWVMFDAGLPMLDPNILGTYFCDDDLFYDEKSLAHRVKFFKSVPNTAFIFTNAVYQDDRRGVSNLLYNPTRIIEHSHEALLKHTYICGASFLTKNKYMQKYRFGKDLPHGQELEVWLKISKMASSSKPPMSFRYSPVVTSVYRIHGEQSYASAPKTAESRNMAYLNTIRNRNR